jgi:class 3 adenylate cyclase
VRDSGRRAHAAVRGARDVHAEAPRRKDPHFEAALQGERKQVTVLFADLKGSMELLADRDPEEARKILDPCFSS